MLRLRCRPGENKRVQLLWLLLASYLALAHPGFSKQRGQCEQQDNWRHGQDQRYSSHENCSEMLLPVELTVNSSPSSCLGMVM